MADRKFEIARKAGVHTALHAVRSDAGECGHVGLCAEVGLCRSTWPTRWNGEESAKRRSGFRTRRHASGIWDQAAGSWRGLGQGGTSSMKRGRGMVGAAWGRPRVTLHKLQWPHTVGRGVTRALRGQNVMLDADLAALYGVDVRVLNQVVKRNPGRFPGDFMFQLNSTEAQSLRSQIVILKIRPGTHRKYAPFAFTEQGVAMLSSVLKSPRAIAVNVEIMRPVTASSRDSAERPEGDRTTRFRSFAGCRRHSPQVGAAWAAPKWRVELRGLPGRLSVERKRGDGF
jgi:hypothetical protein